MMITIDWVHVYNRNNAIERPRCILCSVIFWNIYLKASNLDKHFNRVHGGTETGNDKETLEAKKTRFNRQGTLPKL